MPLGVFVNTGNAFPNGYGVGYRLYDRDGAMFYPVPLNLVVRWSRSIYYRLMSLSPTWMEVRQKRDYDDGYHAGYEAGIQHCKNVLGSWKEAFRS